MLYNSSLEVIFLFNVIVLKGNIIEKALIEINKKEKEKNWKIFIFSIIYKLIVFLIFFIYL
jgi:heme O synthase-like polyprenyltransferase